MAGLVRPSEETVAHVLAICSVLRRQPHHMVRFHFRLLGVLNSVANIIPYGRLHMRPLQLFINAQWSMASQPLCFVVKRSLLSPPRVVGRQSQSDMRVPLTSPKTSSTLGIDSSTTGWGKLKLSQDYGNISGIEPLLDLPPGSNHPDSDRQLDLRIVPKMPRRHQGALADLHNLKVVPSVHGSQHPSGSGTSRYTMADQLSRATRPVATEWALNSHVFRAIN